MADPQTPADWLARATEARSVAGRMHDAEARKSMLEIAAGYEQLARYAGSSSGLTTRHKQQAPAGQATSADIYRSSNGDRWLLISDSSGQQLVRHEPNPASGGPATETPVEVFLAVNGPGSEYEALRRMLSERDYRR